LELPESRHFLCLFRYGKIWHLGSKHNSVGGFKSFVTVGAGCAVLTGINEIVYGCGVRVCTLSLFFIVGKEDLGL
jgi:hypothetical protein